MADLKNLAPLTNFDWDAFEHDTSSAPENLHNSINILNHEVVEGIIIDLNKREVVVNIGFKLDGVIPACEFRYNPDLKIGDTVEVYVENQEDRNGQLVLSHRKARAARSWNRVNEAMENDEIIQGYIKCRTKGGMIVDVFGIEAFLPGSQIDVRPIRDYDMFVGKTMNFKVVKINQEFRNVIVSHKVIVESELETKKQDIINQLENGQVLEGTVKNFAPFGVFVDLGGVDGLIRIKELAWRFIKSPDEVVSIGQKIRVKVIEISDDKKKISLSRKALLPQIENLQEGDFIIGTVVKKVDFGVIVDIGDFTALASGKDLSSINYQIGDVIECNIISNTIDEKKHRKIKVGNKPECEKFVASHNVGNHVEVTFLSSEPEASFITVACDDMKIDVSKKNLIEPYSSKCQEGSLAYGEILDFVFTNFNSESYKIKLSMTPIIRERELEEENWLKGQIERGSIVAAEVTKISKTGAHIHITDTNISTFLPNEELSPNKVINAQDEVFVGEQIEVVYLGETEDRRMKFSRRYLVKDKYDDKLYDLPLMDLLATMDIHTKKFKGKLVSTKDFYFLTDLISVADESSDDDGKLLVDPINGKCLIAIVDAKLRNFFSEGSYYQVELDVANKGYRQKEGTPYLFHVSSNNIKEVKNPYYESVSLTFKQHTSPNTNTSVANLLEEVGQGLYTSKKRMFFELLQNADDSASDNGVIVKVQMNGQYFILTHDGYAFNKHDFESITSAAKSTKSANKKKTGYKGIGFKSVFTNSNSVLIRSRGYVFAFDKSLDTYNDFKAFYFHVNDIEDDKAAQERFIHKYSKYYNEFRGVKDIPWQLLPIWSADRQIEVKSTIFNAKDNVSIALKMNNDTLSEYEDAVKEVFAEPRFMLFLRNTRRIQLLGDEKCYTIQKNVSSDGHHVSLVNSFKPEGYKESYRIFLTDDICVDNDAFVNAGVMIKREERLNTRGEKENYLVRIDNEGNLLAEVPYVPDRIASANETSFSFAIEVDESGHVKPIDKQEQSLYAYLPMNDSRFAFPFYINADFIPNSSREGVQSDNPWNFFLFYNIGKKIVSMISSLASVEETNYLNLLPSNLLKADGVDDEALVESFNRGYAEALSSESFILNDQGAVVTSNEIILDLSELSSYIGYEAFYTLTGTAKRLTCEAIDSKILAKEIFKVEKINRRYVYDIILANMDGTRAWISTCNEEQRNQFFNWLSEDEDNEDIVASIPLIQFGSEWLSTNEISEKDNYLVTTSKFSSIVDLLAKLGFVCSNTVLDGHPLESSIAATDEKDLFNQIKGKDITSLSFAERLRLVTCVADFENVGDSSIANWVAFKNQLGEFKPLNAMFTFSGIAPEWLHGYMLSNGEYDHKLDKYLVKEENILSSIVEPSIADILTKADVFDVYSYFKDKWTYALTIKLIKDNVSNIISVVELYPATQKEYITSLNSVSLDSSVNYTSTSLEYRIIRIAASNPECISILRSKIKVDGIALEAITLKDEFYVTYGTSKYEFHLSKILTGQKDSSKLSRVAKKFFDITGANVIFAQNEAVAKDVYTKLYRQISNTSTLLTVEQFCFLMVIGQNPQYSFITYQSLRYLIRINEAKLFLEILDFCMANGLGDILASCLKTPNITYPCGILSGKFIDCDDYTLPTERVPEFIHTWANTEEKKQFLKKFGVHDVEGNDIQRRKSFKEDKLDNNLWNISDASIIYAFLNWVKSAIQLPATGDNQKEILDKLFGTLRLTKRYYEEDFTEASEWANKLYLDWKKTKNITIKIVPNLLPFRGIYDNVCYFKGYIGEYCYFIGSKTIYLSSTKEAASILTDVYVDRNIPFDKDDWNNIFLVSANLVNDKDAEIEKLKRIIEELRSKKRSDDESEVDEHGKVIEKNETDETSRAEINRQARVAAKEFLSSLFDYDCDEWDAENSYNVITDKIKYKGKTIVVVVCSSQSRKLYLHPRAFAELMQDPDNLLLNYAGDHRIYSLSFDDIFMDNPNVNIVFDTDIVTPSEIAELANKYMYSKKTCFVIENPKHSQSDAINSFGVNEKKEDGEVEIFGLEDIFE